MGAELLGIDSLEADAEMVALAADCLKAAGLNEFQIYIGNVDFFESLLEDAGLCKRRNKGSFPSAGGADRWNRDHGTRKKNRFL